MQKVHEHIIRMSSKTPDLAGKVTRDDLWMGLMFFVTHPEDFISVLEDAEIDENLHPDGTTTLNRKLNFGPYTVQDVVETIPQELIKFNIDETEAIPQSRFEVQIEEPEAGVFFLRFTYFENTEHEQVKGAEQYKPLRIQAWEQKDKDVANKLLEMIAQGKFIATKQ
ncbi:AtaL-like protein [Turicimonas muris]|uniref:AtaL-like protein n=1 Tax=Turicimonas muris TaxID=1796652 RepID=UPI00249578BC|nr:AtaL-like protein [Turicimonas muris]